MNTNNIILLSVGLPILIVIITIVAVAPLIRNLIKTSAMNQQLLVKVQPATATILNAAQTGTSLNDNPQVVFQLEIQPVEGPPFQAQARMFVPLLQMALAFPGNRVEVRYNPLNKQQVAIASFRVPRPVTESGFPPVFVQTDRR